MLLQEVGETLIPGGGKVAGLNVKMFIGAISNRLWYTLDGVNFFPGTADPVTVLTVQTIPFTVVETDGVVTATVDSDDSPIAVTDTDKLTFTSDQLGGAINAEYDITNTDGYEISGQPEIRRRWVEAGYEVTWATGWKAGSYALKVRGLPGPRGRDGYMQQALTVTGTTITFVETKTIYIITPISGATYVFDTSQLPANYIPTFELWINMPATIVSFSLPVSIKWENGAAPYLNAEGLYDIPVRWTGTEWHGSVGGFYPP